MDQKRADVLADLADTEAPADTGAAAQTGARPAAPGGPAVHITVALSTLLGCDDAPGELAGHGPIPAALARELAAEPTGSWQRLVTDTAGHLLDASRTYSPPPRLREHVIARDQTCRFPGCRRTARSCDRDHLVPYSRGGRTAVENLHAPVPAPPPPQTRSRLDRAPLRRRNHRMDHPHRPAHRQTPRRPTRRLVRPVT